MMRTATRSWTTVVALVMLAATACGGGAAQVDRLTLVNPTAFDIDVEVTDDDRQGWLEVGQALRASDTTVEQVLDQGATWIFRFRYAGTELGEQTMQRSELESAQWRLEIPPTFDDELRAAGHAPPPDPNE